MDRARNFGIAALRPAALALVATASLTSAGCTPLTTERMSPLGMATEHHCDNAKAVANDSFPSAAEVGLAHVDTEKTATR